MNYKLISRLLSFVTAAMVLAFLACLAVAFIYRENVTEPNAIFAFSVSAGVAFLFSFLFHRAGRGSTPRIFRKEALGFVGICWITASLIGALPFVLILPEYPIADAVFESVSGFTTTGASVLGDLETLPRSLIFWRSLTHWIGGLGVVVFFVAILSFLGAGGKILFIHESSGRTADIEQGRVRKGVLQLFLLYLGISALCFGVFKLCGLSWFDALCHMFGTVSTGGFSTRSAGIGAFDNGAIEWATILFMLLGATNFFFLLLLLRRQWTQARKFTEVFAYYLILAAAILLFLIYAHFEYDGESNFLQLLRTIVFQVVSVSSTTGFMTEDFDQWPLFAKLSLLVLMVIGGCSASTAGGMKVVRLIVSIRVSVQSVERSFRAHVVRPVMMNGQPLDEAARDNVLSYIVLLALIFWISLPVFGFMERDHSVEGAVSAIVTTFCNVGPGFAEFGPTENFAVLRGPTKIYLSLLMILGRLELFALLALLAPSLWRKFS